MTNETVIRLITAIHSRLLNYLKEVGASYILEDKIIQLYR